MAVAGPGSVCFVPRSALGVTSLASVKHGMLQLIAALTFQKIGIQKWFHAFLWLKIEKKKNDFNDSAAEN